MNPTQLIEPLYSSPYPEWGARFLKANTQKGEVALDIGANFGGAAVTLLERFQTVHAFEPVPDMFAKLNSLNNPRIIANRLAVSNAPGRLENVNVFNTWSLLPDLSPISAKALDYVRKSPFSSDVTTVDIYCGAGITPDYIKIDVDGFEPFVLQGAVQTLKRAKCTIFLEYSYLPERFFGFRREDFTALIYDLGYQAYSLDGSFRAETASQMLACYPENTSYDVVLIHKEFN